MKVLIDNDEINMTVSGKFMKPSAILNGKSLADYMLENTLEKLEAYKRIFGVQRLKKINFETYDVDT